MLRNLLVLSILGCALGQFFNGGGMDGMKKYSDMKVMESCLGKTVMDEMCDKMVAAVTMCSASPQDNEIQLDFSVMPQMVAAMMPGDKMKEAQDKANAFAANATCYLSQMDFIKADGSPNYESCVTWINAMDITPTLKAGLMEAHNLCKSFSECAPVDTVKCPITRRFGRIMAYKKCSYMKVQEACMMEDMKVMMTGPKKMSLEVKKMMMDFEDVLSYGNVMKVMDM